MAEENKQHLPYVLYGITSRIGSLFFQKLILFDQQILQSKHLRHYDYQCQGLMNLCHFLERKNNKNLISAFQMIKNPETEQEKENEFVRFEYFKQIEQKPQKNQIQGNLTKRTKFITRANTSIQESDNSLIFSPNIKKNIIENRKQYFNNSFTEGGDRSLILQKLLNRVKKVNAQSYQESLQPAKSSYFNLTLGGKQSLQTFQNNCNCTCLHHNNTVYCKNENKQMKRRKILQKMSKIQNRICEQQPVYYTNYVNSRPMTYTPREVNYSVYEPLTFKQRPNQIVYATPRANKYGFNQFENSYLPISKSVIQLNLAKKVYH